MSDRDQFQLGSLSHYINARAAGYRELPSFPTEAPDPTVRNSVVPLPERPPEPARQPTRERGFYSDTSSEDGTDRERDGTDTADWERDGTDTADWERDGTDTADWERDGTDTADWERDGTDTADWERDGTDTADWERDGTDWIRDCYQGWVG